jgi:hypothetical protein
MPIGSLVGVDVFGSLRTQPSPKTRSGKLSIVGRD